MRHIFLTGEVQIGKSTIIRKVVAELGVSLGGFCSGFGPDRGEANKWLYLWDAASDPVYEQCLGVVQFSEGKAQVFPERFDQLGGDALRRARQQDVELILMDECGRFEGMAAGFLEEIFKTLERDTPVLGVVRQGFHGWLDQLRAHPDVQVITVTRENRDELPGQLAQQLREVIRKKV